MASLVPTLLKVLKMLTIYNYAMLLSSNIIPGNVFQHLIGNTGTYIYIALSVEDHQVIWVAFHTLHKSCNPKERNQVGILYDTNEHLLQHCGYIPHTL